jgi:hypothetical protein
MSHGKSPATSMIAHWGSADEYTWSSAPTARSPLPVSGSSLEATNTRSPTAVDRLTNVSKMNTTAATAASIIADTIASKQGSATRTDATGVSGTEGSNQRAKRNSFVDSARNFLRRSTTSLTDLIKHNRESEASNHQNEHTAEQSDNNRRATSHLSEAINIQSKTSTLLLSGQQRQSPATHISAEHANAFLSPPRSTHAVRTAISNFDTPVHSSQTEARLKNDKRSTITLPYASTSSSSVGFSGHYQPSYSVLTDSAATAAILTATAGPGAFRRFSRPVPPVDKDTPPMRQLHDKAQAILRRLQNANPSALNRRLRRPYDAEEVSKLVESVLEDVLEDVHTLPDRFTWLLYDKSSYSNSKSEVTTEKAKGSDDIDVPLLAATLGDFVIIVDLVSCLLEESIELRRIINSISLAYVQNVEERSRESIGVDYIGDTMHSVWQVRGSAGIYGGDENDAMETADSLSVGVLFVLCHVYQGIGHEMR